MTSSFSFNNVTLVNDSNLSPNSLQALTTITHTIWCLGGPFPWFHYPHSSFARFYCYLGGHWSLFKGNPFLCSSNLVYCLQGGDSVSRHGLQTPWNTSQPCLQPWSNLHQFFLERAFQTQWHFSEHENRLSPTNRRSNGGNEPRVGVVPLLFHAFSTLKLIQAFVPYWMLLQYFTSF